MFWFVYNVLFAIGYMLVLPHFLLRMWRRGGYRRGFLQRLGRFDSGLRKRLAERRRIWIHAVSVGEIFVALRFMEEIRSSEPGIAFVLTTTTSTGHKVAEGKIGNDDVLLYFPVDLPFIMGRILNLLKPRAVILTESELWPNFIRKAKACGIPVILINGRMSASSFKGYRRLRVFFRRIVRLFDLMLVQSDLDRQRLIELGAVPTAVRAMGSAKYDITKMDLAGQEDARQALRICGMDDGSLILVGGSTWKGEEEILLDLLKRLKTEFPALKLILVPRHAERRAEVEAQIKSRGLNQVRRSEIGGAAGGMCAKADVLLVDTTGELKDFYAVADVIFVGKSLTARGGQNIIEPAALGKPIIVGPHMTNFEAVMSDFLSAGAIVQVADAEALEAAVRRLLGDEARRVELGGKAKEVVVAGRGVARESVKLIMAILSSNAFVSRQ